MDLQLAGKTVLVTGGASNIGRNIVFGLVVEGANVALIDIDRAQAEKTLQTAIVVRRGARVAFYPADVTDHRKVEEAAKAAIGDFAQIHALVNSVGWTYDRLFLEKPREEWEKEVNINLWGAINTMRALLPHMVEKRYGRVVMLASDAGKMGEFREAVYGACKAGVIALSKSLGRETGRYNITFNTVCPGMTIPASGEDVGEQSLWRDMSKLITPDLHQKVAQSYPLRRLGTAKDIANAVLFLVSDCASFVTGQSLSVSGGYTMQ